MARVNPASPLLAAVYAMVFGMAMTPLMEAMLMIFSPALLDHSRDNRLCHCKRGGEMDVENAIPLFQGELQGWFSHLYAGVIYHDVNSPHSPRISLT